MEKPSEVKNGFEPGWLGKVLIEHGLDWEKISCRGTIDNLDDCEPDCNFFTLDSDTAWSPTIELWEAVVAKYTGVSFVYIAEEAGSEIYINTDIEGTYFPDRFLLEIHGDAPIPEGWYPGQDKPKLFEIREHFTDFDELVYFCASLTGKEFGTLEEIQGYFSDIFDNEDNTIAGVHEFETA
jgi:hypothetical protein